MVPLALAGTAGWLAACGSPPQRTAHWRDRELTIDGKLDDWGNLVGELDAGRESAAARVGIANDGEALYLALQTSDPSLMRLVSHRGLTVWVDPSGGRAHAAGVRFPLPAARPASRWGEIGGSRPGGAQLDSLELLGPQPYTRRELAAPGADGVLVAIAFAERGLAYELRVPLAAAPPAWGLGVKPGALIGVGVQSKGVEPRPMRGRGEAGGPDGQDPGGGGPGGGSEGPPSGDEPPGDGSEPPPGGGRGGGAHRRGPGGPGGRPDAVRDFELWATVRLAASPG
ncbi:MAG TPA: hypothetical protein VN811_16780 [Thermoanaerobaculia bacterium]|nr:hypothetical protein [Thermoanaerobaculia bacterium]